jgi:hypothetical protein
MTHLEKSMDQQAKEQHSKRLHQKEVVVKRKLKIAKAHGLQEKQPHRLAKKSPLSCGNPQCVMCANPRKTFKELTIQEKRHQQDLESQRDRHSNGVINESESDM